MKETRKEVNSRRHLLTSVVWFIVLTFPIWLYWFGALTQKAPIGIYLILVIFSYYAILVLAPYIGVPWLLVLIFLVAIEIRKMWVGRKLLHRDNVSLNA